MVEDQSDPFVIEHLPSSMSSEVREVLVVMHGMISDGMVVELR